MITTSTDITDRKAASEEPEGVSSGASAAKETKDKVRDTALAWAIPKWDRSDTTVQLLLHHGAAELEDFYGLRGYCVFSFFPLCRRGAFRDSVSFSSERSDLHLNLGGMRNLG